MSLLPNSTENRAWAKRSLELDRETDRFATSEQHAEFRELKRALDISRESKRLEAEAEERREKFAVIEEQLRNLRGGVRKLLLRFVPDLNPAELDELSALVVKKLQ